MFQQLPVVSYSQDQKSVIKFKLDKVVWGSENEIPMERRATS